MLTAAPVAAGGATTPPVKNGNLVFVEQLYDISTQTPGPANSWTLLTSGKNPKYSPDGRQLAFTDDGCTDCQGPNHKSWVDVWVRVLSTGAERRVARFQGEGENTEDVFTNYRTNVTWSPDGKQLVVSGDHSLVKVVVATGKQTVIYQTTVGDFVNGPAWSPDGTRIAFTSASHSIIKLIDPDGKNLRTFTATGEFNYTPDWSPDSRTIAFVTSRFQEKYEPDYFLELVTLPRSGKGTPFRVSYLSNPRGRDYGVVAWSPDGKKIAVQQRMKSKPGEDNQEELQVRAYLPDGSHDYALTDGVGDDGTPGLDWAPKVTG